MMIPGRKESISVRDGSVRLLSADEDDDNEAFYSSARQSLSEPVYVCADRGSGGEFGVGAQVEYNSQSQGKWIPAKVMAYNPNTQMYDLDCKLQVTRDQIRPLPTRVSFGTSVGSPRKHSGTPMRPHAATMCPPGPSEGVPSGGAMRPHAATMCPQGPSEGVPSGGVMRQHSATICQASSPRNSALSNGSTILARVPAGSSSTSQIVSGNQMLPVTRVSGGSSGMSMTAPPGVAGNQRGHAMTAGSSLISPRGTPRSSGIPSSVSFSSQQSPVAAAMSPRSATRSTGMSGAVSFASCSSFAGQHSPVAAAAYQRSAASPRGPGGYPRANS